MSPAEFLRDAPTGGRWNCSTLSADWCVALGHPDYAAKWRDVAGFDDFFALAEGELLPLWEEGIGDALPVATAPFHPGDIGVVSLHGIEAGAVFTGERWAFRRVRGVALAPVADEHVLKAWRP